MDCLNKRLINDVLLQVGNTNELKPRDENASHGNIKALSAEVL